MNPSRSIIALVVLALCGGASVAAPITHEYRIDTVASIVRTSGGFGGRGFGTRRVSGLFRTTTDGQDFQLTNLCVAPLPWRFPEYPGTIGNDGHFSGTQSPCPSFASNSFSGEIVGDRLYLNGVYHDCAYDGYQYNYAIEAMRVHPGAADPTPSPSEGECPLSLRILVDRVVSFLLTLLDNLWGVLRLLIRSAA